MSCQCDLCQYVKKAEEKIRQLPEIERPFFEDMFNRLMHAELDRDVFRAKFERKWPVEIDKHE